MAEIEGEPGWSVEWPIPPFWVRMYGLPLAGRLLALVAAGHGYEWEPLAMTADEMDAFAKALTTEAREMREQHP